MSVQNAMTADFLRSAYGGESMAHMRYLIWADVADKEKMPNIGRLFRAIAYAEYAHADNHFTVLKEQHGDFTVPAGAIFGIGNTVENLQGGIDGELHEIEQMYPVYLETARYQKEKAAERAFHFALEAEKVHATLFKKAQDVAKEGKDLDIGTVHVCSICGHTTTDGLPDVCPICGAKSQAYKAFE
ncbi:rubrerythrin family protein [Serpentinicella sp. ANB-PHB4]|uniref:rubrerythrin family protein n=1 Tax=Serpentinicella sp. ANB-PHB4 TaxID=3074076 RepID=UPI0028621DED|nr:rubrerythrin family protein [Serpentinicella sp. ANB-PHB4]MDR5659448.1 rubrerythrin family protein [Serpentinicella sp. ANB-PHB4]